MLGEEKERITRHVREIKAKSKAKSFKSLFHRMRSEQEFRKILTSLEKHDIHFQEILPSLVPERQKVEYFPDFIIWKKGISIPLFLMESNSEKRCTITQSEMQEFSRYLRKTAREEMAISWMISSDFPCKMLNVEELSKLIETRKNSFLFEGLTPFKKAIIEFMEEEAPIWPVKKLEKLPRIERFESLTQTLKSTIDETFRRELKKRRPQLPYKQRALQDISKRDLESIGVFVQRYFENQINGKDFARYLRDLAERSRKDED